MNVIQAVKSGKKIKRPKWERFWKPEDLSFINEDVIAEDWQLEPEDTLLSEESFQRAWDRANERWLSLGGSVTLRSLVKEEIFK